MTTDFYKFAVIMFGIICLGGCSSIPPYRIMLQNDGGDGKYTLWVDNGTGGLSSLQYSAWSSHLLKRLDRDDIFMLDQLNDGETPVFFDLFQNGKRYLLMQDSEGGARGPFHLRIIEFDSAGWRQLYYGPCDENPVLHDADHDGRVEFCHGDFYSSPLPPVCGEIYGNVILTYSHGKLQPSLRLNKKMPLSDRDFLQLKSEYQAHVKEMEANTTYGKEDVQVHFVKSILIDLLYEGRWGQRDQFLQDLEFDPQKGKELKKEIIRELKASPYREFVMQLNRKTEKNVVK